MGRPLTWDDLTTEQASQLSAFVSEEHVLTLKRVHGRDRGHPPAEPFDWREREEDRLMDIRGVSFPETSAMIATALAEARAVAMERGPVGLMEWAKDQAELALGMAASLPSRMRSTDYSGAGTGRGSSMNLDSGYYSSARFMRRRGEDAVAYQARLERMRATERGEERARALDDGTATARFMPSIRWVAGVYVNQFEMKPEPWPGWTERLKIRPPLEILDLPDEAPDPPEPPPPTKPELALAVARELTSATNPHRYRDYRLLRVHKEGDKLPTKLLVDVGKRIDADPRSVRRYLKGVFELPDELRYGI